jgi:hypothetical protein
MSDSDTKKIVNTGNPVHAFDEATVSNAARSLSGRTAQFSATGVAARLSNVANRVGQTTQQPQASATNVAPVVIQSSEKK